MARNSSGTHSLPTGNPVVTGTPVSSVTHNDTMSDISAEITDSLSRTGKGAMQANLAMGNFKVTGVGAATTAGDAIMYGQASAALASLLITSTGNISFTGTGDNRIQNSATSDGSDTARILLATTSALTPARGAYLYVAGNEHATTPGRLGLVAGDTGYILIDGDIVVNDDLSVTGAVTGASFSGTGTALTALNASELTSGTLPTGRISGAGAYNVSAATVDGEALGYRGVPRVTAGFENGKCRAIAAGVTINTSDLATGVTFSVYNNSGSAVTITQGAGVTQRRAGTTTTGNLSLAPRGMATFWCNSGTEVIGTGNLS